MTSKTTLLRFTYMMCLVVILMTTFALSVQGIKKHPLRRDELTTLGHIGALNKDSVSIQETIHSVEIHSVAHPPLFYMIANVWGHNVSFHYQIIFLLPVFFGMLALAVTYRIAADLGGYKSGILSILLMMTSVLFLHYSSELRQYALVIFWTGAIWLLYSRMVKTARPLQLYQLLILTFFVACYIYTHYSAIFFLLTLGIYHLLRVPKTKEWWQISISVCLAGLFFIPWLPQIPKTFGRIEVTRVDSSEGAWLYNSDLLNFFPQFWGNGSAILFIILVMLACVAVYRKQQGSRYAMFFCVTVATIILILNGQFEFVKRLRYLVFTIGIFYVLGGIGLSVLFDSRWGRYIIPLFFVVWIYSGYYFQNSLDFYEQTGVIGVEDFTEYQLLEPLIYEHMGADEILGLVIKDFKEIKQSKQELASPYQYYMKPLNINTQRIHSSPEAGNFDLAKLLDKLEGRPDFWLSYRFEPNADLLNFLDAVGPEYQLCQSIPYGNQSHFEQYVKISEFDSLCNGQS